MRKARKAGFLGAAALAVALLFAAKGALAAGLVDFGSPADPWKKEVLQFFAGKEEKLRFFQLGDSHTAADFFSGVMRERLQAEYGDGGIGYITPARVSGNRLARVTFSQSGVTVVTNRSDENDYALGGVSAFLDEEGGTVTVNPRPEELGPERALFFVRTNGAEMPISISDATGSRDLPADPDSPNWQGAQIPVRLPFTYSTLPGGAWEVGGIYLENGARGAVYSASGLNGAQFSQTDRWGEGWTHELALLRPQLLILSFGTNEAFYPKYDGAAFRAFWKEAIDRIRADAPGTGILIVGASESLRSTAGACGTRPVALDDVQAAQLEIAREKGTLYWSWQEAQGGPCSMKGWIEAKKGRRDGVHFTAGGYSELAGGLASDLISLLNSLKGKQE